MRLAGPLSLIKCPGTPHWQALVPMFGNLGLVSCQSGWPPTNSGYTISVDYFCGARNLTTGAWVLAPSLVIEGFASGFNPPPFFSTDHNPTVVVADGDCDSAYSVTFSAPFGWWPNTLQASPNFARNMPGLGFADSCPEAQGWTMKVWEGSCASAPGAAPVASVRTRRGRVAVPTSTPVTTSTPTVSLRIVRPVKCRWLGVRTEFKSGCAGWRCRHSCAKGLPAVPGEFCQTCRAYSAEVYDDADEFKDEPAGPGWFD